MKTEKSVVEIVNQIESLFVQLDEAWDHNSEGISLNDDYLIDSYPFGEDFQTMCGLVTDWRFFIEELAALKNK